MQVFVELAVDMKDVEECEKTALTGKDVIDYKRDHYAAVSTYNNKHASKAAPKRSRAGDEKAKGACFA